MLNCPNAPRKAKLSLPTLGTYISKYLCRYNSTEVSTLLTYLLTSIVKTQQQQQPLNEPWKLITTYYLLG